MHTDEIQRPHSNSHIINNEVVTYPSIGTLYPRVIGPSTQFANYFSLAITSLQIIGDLTFPRKPGQINFPGPGKCPSMFKNLLEKYCL